MRLYPFDLFFVFPSLYSSLVVFLLFLLGEWRYVFNSSLLKEKRLEAATTILHNKRISVSTYVILSLAITHRRSSEETLQVIRGVQEVLRDVILEYFKKYDYFDEMAIDLYDFPLLLRDMGEDIVIRDFIRQEQSATASQESPHELAQNMVLSFEDCYYSILSTVGGTHQDILSQVREVINSNLETHPHYNNYNDQNDPMKDMYHSIYHDPSSTHVHVVNETTNWKSSPHIVVFTVGTLITSYCSFC